MVFRRFLLGSSVVAVAGTSFALTRVTFVVKQGDAVDTSTASGFTSVYTSGDGKPGVLVSLADGRRAMWFDNGVVFTNDQALPDVLTGGEASIGVAAGGQFIYSPSFNGGDAVVTDNGRLMVDDDPIPGTPEFSSFNSRPMMLATGEAVWIGGFAATAGGATAGRVLLRCTDTSNPAGITAGIRSGDVLPGGMVITSTGLGFTYDLSDNGSSHIHRIIVNDGVTNEIVYLNGNKIARVAEPAFGGEVWSSFNVVGTNNTGDSIFSGNTNGPTTADEVLVYNGAEALREGQVVDGVTLGSIVDWAAIDNSGRFGVIWDSSSTETLFIGDVSNFAGATAVLSIGETLDVDGDDVADYTITDFNPSTTIERSGELTDNPLVYFSIDVTPIGGGASQIAIMGVRTAPCPGDVNADGRIELTDLSILLANFGIGAGATSGTGDSDGDGDIDLTDLSVLLANFGSVCL